MNIFCELDRYMISLYSLGISRKFDHSANTKISLLWDPWIYAGSW